MQEQRQELREQCSNVRARPVFVDVYAHLDKDGKVKFCHDWRLQENGPSEGNGPIEVPHGTPRSPIHFQLHDDTGLKLKFFDKSEDSIWASVDKCPDAKGGGGQIDYNDSVSGGPNLRVLNSNSEKCELHYALRFKDKNNNLQLYDPVIRNGGGGP